MSKKSEIRSFEDLKVWQISREIRNSIFQLVKNFPKEEIYNLSSQMIRCSRTIGDNISEGYGRYHFQENIQFCRQARGSAYELNNHLITALDCDYITKSEFSHFKKQVNRCIQLINDYINYLQKIKASSAKESNIQFQITDPPQKPLNKRFNE